MLKINSLFFCACISVFFSLIFQRTFNIKLMNDLGKNVFAFRKFLLGSNLEQLIVVILKYIGQDIDTFVHVLLEFLLIHTIKTASITN